MFVDSTTPMTPQRALVIPGDQKALSLCSFLGARWNPAIFLFISQNSRSSRRFGFSLQWLQYHSSPHRHSCPAKGSQRTTKRYVKSWTMPLYQLPNFTTMHLRPSAAFLVNFSSAPSRPSGSHGPFQCGPVKGLPPGVPSIRRYRDIQGWTFSPGGEKRRNRW